MRLGGIKWCECGVTQASVDRGWFLQRRVIACEWLRGHGFALTMDLRHDHGALIHVVRACDNADAPNLIAIGGESSVSVSLIVCAAIFSLRRPVCVHPQTRRPTRL